MAVIQDIMDLARLDLNDLATGTIVPRYPQSDLLKYANDGIAKAVRLRPDLNYGNYGTGTGTSQDYTDLTTASTFPLDLLYRPAVAAYIVARAEEGDDEFANQAKADHALIDYMKGLGIA